MIKIIPFEHYSIWQVIPSLAVCYEKNYYLSIDLTWLKWGLSIVLKDK